MLNAARIERPCDAVERRYAGHLWLGDHGRKAGRPGVGLLSAAFQSGLANLGAADPIQVLVAGYSYNISVLGSAPMPRSWNDRMLPTLTRVSFATQEQP